MAVDFDAFLRWVENKFGEVKVKGKEIRANSPWEKDTNHHLWCSPSGGKKKREHGVYRCFKTEKRGTLTGLVMEFENCSFDEALDILEGGCNLREMEQRLEEMFSKKTEKIDNPVINKLKLPPYSFRISEMADDSFQKMEAISYLAGRKIPTDGLYYCTAGDYGGRIIIPYYDSIGALIYFNSRYIGPNKKALRYMGPPKELGIGKGDVLYMHEWPKPGSRVYLTEGEFDARTLNLCGLYGVACGGRYLTDKQIEMLRPYKICMSFDTDKAGEQAQLGDRHVDDYKGPTKVANSNMKWGNELMRIGLGKNLTYVRPPKIYKDWNKMMCEVGIDLVGAYIQKCEKSLDSIELLKRLDSKQWY